MKTRYQRRHDGLVRIEEFLDQHPVAIPRVIFLRAKLRELSTQMLAHGAEQIHGHGRFRSGATQRRTLAKELHVKLREMSDTARGLDPEEFPGITEHFRAKQSYGSFQKLLATARAFLTAASTRKELFIERAYPEDFAEQLEAMIEAFAAATQFKDSGRQEQRHGTAGLDVLARRVTQVRRELDSIVSKHLRDTNPTLLAVWKTTARTYRDPQHRAPATEGVPASASAVTESADIRQAIAMPTETDGFLPTGGEPRKDGVDRVVGEGDSHALVREDDSCHGASPCTGESLCSLKPLPK